MLNIYSQETAQLFDYNWKPVSDNTKARFYSLTIKKDSVWNRKDYYIYEQRLQMEGNYKDSACKIAQGIFNRYHPNGFLSSTGNYDDNKKEGTWLSYHDNGMMKDSAFYKEGQVLGESHSWYASGFSEDSSVTNIDGSGVTVVWFDNGKISYAGNYAAGHKPTGKWQYFHHNGQPSAMEIYDNGALIDKQYFNEKGVEEADTTNKDSESTYPGGIEAWINYLKKKLYWPKGLQLANSNQVTIVVDWMVDDDGKVKNVKVITPVHPEFDNIALNIISRSPKWIPAISHNRKVKAYRRQPLTFAQTN
jgi:antitoxin component YwqK of YwqJK toxin-antitoxin module